MTADKIKEVLDELIGPIEPIAESTYDYKVYDNVQKLINVTEHLLTKIDETAYTYEKSSYASCAKIGQLAYMYEKQLKEDLKDLE